MAFAQVVWDASVFSFPVCRFLPPALVLVQASSFWVFMFRAFYGQVKDSLLREGALADFRSGGVIW